MILQMYSVFDSKVGAYSAPFCARARGEAVRNFSIACQDDSLPFKKDLPSYRLFVLAEFDDQSGVIRPLKPEPVIGADEF